MRREKVRRVRVAALTVEGEGCRAILLGERPVEEGEVVAVDFSCGNLRERRVETKVGRVIVGAEWKREERGGEERIFGGEERSEREKFYSSNERECTSKGR